MPGNPRRGRPNSGPHRRSHRYSAHHDPATGQCLVHEQAYLNTHIKHPPPPPGADPGFRSGGGGVRTFRRGGGGVVQEFQERIQIVAGPWANQQAKKKYRHIDSRRGGGSDHTPPPPKKKNSLYPRLPPPNSHALTNLHL